MHNRRSLPPHVHTVISRGREYFYFQAGRGSKSAGPRTRLRDPWSTEEYVAAAARAENNQWAVTIERAVVSARTRSRNHNLPFSIDSAFVRTLAEKQKFRCAVSGIEFEADGYDACAIRPFSMSIDRIDPRHGYAKDNVRLVCCIANAAMGEWGLGALERLALAIIEKNKTQP